MKIDERIIFDNFRPRGWNIIVDSEFRNPTDIVGLRNLYDRAETQIRSLESLGVKRRILLKLINTHPVETDTLGTRFEFNRSQRTKGLT
ncbi:hypothetical protein TNCV_808601 [Trichonephila clavipes]|nr:hypothetical protein TNCV_808601 [Trichonephila clavipes]